MQSNILLNRCRWILKCDICIIIKLDFLCTRAELNRDQSHASRFTTGTTWTWQAWRNVICFSEDRNIFTQLYEYNQPTVIYRQSINKTTNNNLMQYRRLLVYLLTNRTIHIKDIRKTTNIIRNTILNSSTNMFRFHFELKLQLTIRKKTMFLFVVVW